MEANKLREIVAAWNKLRHLGKTRPNIIMYLDTRFDMEGELSEVIRAIDDHYVPLRPGDQVLIKDDSAKAFYGKIGIIQRVMLNTCIVDVLGKHGEFDGRPACIAQHQVPIRKIELIEAFDYEKAIVSMNEEELEVAIKLLGEQKEYLVMGQDFEAAAKCREAQDDLRKALRKLRDDKVSEAGVKFKGVFINGLAVGKKRRTIIEDD